MDNELEKLTNYCQKEHCLSCEFHRDFNRYGGPVKYGCYFDNVVAPCMIDIKYVLDTINGEND